MVELAAGQARAAGLDGQVEVSPADAHALPFEDGQFELVVAVGVIPWLHSPREAVAEMRACCELADMSYSPPTTERG